jgi:hypothetical protein
MQRCSFQESASLDQRLTEQAGWLRQDAQSTPHGIVRDKLIREARQAETASHIREWVSSPGLRPPP